MADKQYNNQENQKPEKQLNIYLKFTGVAFQMIAIICFFSYLGVWLDGKFPNDYSLLTVIFSLIGVISAMYVVIKQVVDLNKNKND